MRHQVRKNRFGYGQDANEMLLRKLAKNFLKTGYLKTTITKAKVLKSHLENLVSKMVVFSQANKNYLLKYLGDEKIVEDGFKVIGQSFKEIKGGYVKIIKTGLRKGDGSLVAEVRWAHPLITTKEEKPQKEKEETKKEVKKVKKIKKDEKTNKTDKTS